MARKPKSTKSLLTLPAKSAPKAPDKVDSKMRFTYDTPPTSLQVFRDLVESLETYKMKTDILQRAKTAYEEYKKGKGLGFLPRVTITPEMAKDLLSLNHEKNRKIKLAYVERYRLDLEKDEFKYTGDTIRIDWNGKLMDGQKRLFAIVLSGKSAVFHIEFGFEPETIEALDTGQIRSISDILRMMDIKAHPDSMAGAIKKLIQFNTKRKISGVVSNTEVSHHEVVKWIKDPKNKSEQLGDMVEAYRDPNLDNNKLLKPSEWAFLHYLFAYSHPGRQERARVFMNGLQKMDGISSKGKSAPIYGLHQELTGFSKQVQKSKSSGQSVKRILALKIKFAIRAWNDYITDAWRSSNYKLELDKKYKETYDLEPVK